MSSSTSNKQASPVAPKGFGGADRQIDARGLLCPEPLVLCRQALGEIADGGTIHVLATDPHAEIDFEVFARRTRHGLRLSEWVDGVFHVLVQKG